MDNSQKETQPMQHFADRLAAEITGSLISGCRIIRPVIGASNSQLDELGIG